jgi:peroxiredoxin
VRETFDQLTALETDVYGVNEADAESHRRFIDELELPFDLLVDTDLEIARAYQALRREGSRINRTVVIVGKDGKILHYEHGAPEPALLLDVLRNAQDG